MTRILHIMTDTNIGGAGIWVLNSVGAMSGEFEVYVALPRNAQLKARLLAVIEASKIIEVDHIGDQSFSVAGFKALKQVIKQVHPDIVHTHASLAGRMAAKWLGKIAIVNSRHCIEPISTGLSGLVKRIINNSLSHRIIAVSEAIKVNLEASGIKADKVTLLSNGVQPIKKLGDDEIRAAKGSFGITDQALTIGFIGRLEAVKGPMFIPEIVKALDEITEVSFRIVIAGDGSLRDDLTSSIEEKDLGHLVQCLGLVDNVTAFYNSVDIVVNTSRSEGIPMSLIEAMSIGLPLVAFDVGSLHQLIEVEGNGYLVEAFDTNAYATKLKRLLECEEERVSFGRRSKEIMVQRFHVDQMNRQLEGIYREVKL